MALRIGSQAWIGSLGAFPPEPVQASEGQEEHHGRPCTSLIATMQPLSANLNRGEDRHSLARVVFHGKRGELRQHYREGQEDQLGALGLVVNVIVLWNTIYMDAVIEQLRSEGYPLKPEDVGRLSPLMFDHINFLGRYAFALPDSVAHGQLRPLRSADETDDE